MKSQYSFITNLASLNPFFWAIFYSVDVMSTFTKIKPVWCWYICYLPTVSHPSLQLGIHQLLSQVPTWGFPSQSPSPCFFKQRKKFSKQNFIAFNVEYQQNKLTFMFFLNTTAKKHCILRVLLLGFVLSTYLCIQYKSSWGSDCGTHF